jgi:nitroreductase
MIPAAMALAPDELLTSLRWRYATKKFDPARRIPADVWVAIEESMVLTPSSFGLQPWKFMIVEDPELRTRLRTVSWGQSQVTDASHYVVFTARTAITEADILAWTERLSQVQGTPLEHLAPLHRAIEGFVKAMTPAAVQAWNIRQIYIALGQLMTSAAMMRIDTCPMEGIDPGGYDRVLKLEGTGYSTAVACALGYRSSDDRHASMAKVRFSADQVIERIGEPAAVQ